MFFCFGQRGDNPIETGWGELNSQFSCYLQSWSNHRCDWEMTSSRSCSLLSFCSEVFVLEVSISCTVMFLASRIACGSSKQQLSYFTNFSTWLFSVVYWLLFCICTIIFFLYSVRSMLCTFRTWNQRFRPVMEFFNQVTNIGSIRRP